MGNRFVDLAGENATECLKEAAREGRGFVTVDPDQLRNMATTASKAVRVRYGGRR